MRIHVVLAVLIAALLQPVSADANTLTRTIGSTSFEFVPPKGQCLLDNVNDPFAAVHFNFLANLLKAGGNTLIAASVECRRFAAMRKGDTSPMLDYTTFFTPNNAVEASVPQNWRQELCTLVRKKGEAVFSGTGIKDLVNTKMKEMRLNAKVTGTTYIGVVGEDEYGCYVATLANMVGPDRKTILLSAVTIMTVVRQKAISMVLYHEYKGPKTVEASLAEAKAVMAAYGKLNP